VYPQEFELMNQHEGETWREIQHIREMNQKD